MKAVLMSIQPKWCELIANGKKTVEVRKTKPKLETPFKVYIYQTRRTWTFDIYSRIADWQGKVIGEFICNEITVAEYGSYRVLPKSKTLIDELDLLEYADRKTVYGWYISDLVIYDKPKELSKFWKCNYPFDCGVCDYFDGFTMGCEKPKRPPQSWCYVEELG